MFSFISAGVHPTRTRRVAARSTITAAIASLVVIGLVTLHYVRIPVSQTPELEAIESGLRDAYVDEAFLLAQIAESKSGRPALSVDLRDSTATLWIRGIVVHSTPISSIQRSFLWDLAPDGRRIQDLRTPFILVNSEASIPHAPVREIQAPSDTAEARLRPPESFVIDTAEAYVNLFFDRNVEIQLVPPAEDRTLISSLSSSTHHRFRRASELLELASGWHAQPPARWVRIEMPSSDIRTIYRALPSDGRLVIRLDG